MIRKINITHHKNKNKNIDGFTEIYSSDIDSIPNYSVDILYCGIINIIEKNKVFTFLDQIKNKIRYGGQLTIVINDIHNICEMFINKQIQEDQFFDIINNTNNNISDQKITKYILQNNEFDVLGIEKNKSLIAISFARKSNE